ncbi:unnamed protein product [[Actinomadura] parvosata subsp. kistnae]|nr:unnamed protein product [Actinomadura parvosata subsp. kistnae]
MLTAHVLDGDRVLLNAEPVVGGTITAWPVGSNPGNMFLRCAVRPDRALPPYDMPAHEKKRWDGRAAAASRAWYVLHVHGKTSQQIVEMPRRQTT